MDANISIRAVEGAEVEELLPLLLLAEPSERALRWSLDNLSDTLYRLDIDGVLTGAATVRWDDEPAEIVELGVRPDAQGKGYGQAFVRWMLEEGRRRAKTAMIVGARNAAIGNLAFYQKCGFRMDHIRRDYFWYYREPQVENGIPVRDLVVFRCELE